MAKETVTKSERECDQLSACLRCALSAKGNTFCLAEIWETVKVNDGGTGKVERRGSEHGRGSVIGSAVQESDERTGREKKTCVFCSQICKEWRET